MIWIFDRYNLNTTKYLDYIDFKKAFLIYHGRDGLVSQELKEQILALKNGMNTVETSICLQTIRLVLIKIGYWD